MSEETKEKIIINHIDTTVAAQNFLKYFENKTYFLNGAWGSGKTEFLKKVKDNSENKKFAELRLWELKDDRSVISIGYSAIHPLLGKFWVFFSTLIIASAIYFTLVKPILNNWQSVILLLGAILAGIWQFLNLKSDLFYSKTITFCLGNKVLIVDDFDRISKEKQDEAYKLFNLLKGCLPIIFVGDFDNLARKEDNYLQKIIDMRIGLPYILHPDNIWRDYISLLEKRFAVTLTNGFRNIILIEKRSLRERKQFNDYINQEFFLNQKYGHVQTNQQLVIIYMYLFHNEEYQGLLSGQFLNYTSKKDEEAFTRGLNKYQSSDNQNENYVVNEFYELLSSNDVYPPCFRSNRIAYLINEFPSNSTDKEIEKILEDDQELLSKILFSVGTDDFFKYITSNYSKFNKERKNKLLHISLEQILGYKSSPLIQFIIIKKEREIMLSRTFISGSGGAETCALPPEKVEKKDQKIDDIIYERWSNILDEFNFDFSQKLYFFEYFKLFSFDKLGKRFKNLDLNSQVFTESKRKDFYLLVYLSATDLWEKFDAWEESLFRKIEELSDKQYLSFWIMQEILGIPEFGGNPSDSFDNFDYIPDDKKYYIFTKRYVSGGSNMEIKDVNKVNKIIRKRFENTNYSFIDRKDKSLYERFEEQRYV